MENWYLVFAYFCHRSKRYPPGCQCPSLACLCLVQASWFVGLDWLKLTCVLDVKAAVADAREGEVDVISRHRHKYPGRTGTDISKGTHTDRQGRLVNDEEKEEDMEEHYGVRSDVLLFVLC